MCKSVFLNGNVEIEIVRFDWEEKNVNCFIPL